MPSFLNPTLYRSGKELKVVMASSTFCQSSSLHVRGTAAKPQGLPLAIAMMQSITARGYVPAGP